MDHECWCKGHWEGWVRKVKIPRVKPKLLHLLLITNLLEHTWIRLRDSVWPLSINQSINQSILFTHVTSSELKTHLKYVCAKNK